MKVRSLFAVLVFAVFVSHSVYAAPTCTRTYVTCKTGYSLSSGSCVACSTSKSCSSWSSEYNQGTYNECTQNQGSSCYKNVTRGCTQNNAATPSGCSSITQGSCSCTGGTYKKYANGSTSGTTTNETCTKSYSNPVAKANYYVSGNSCPACSSFSNTYTKSDGGSISSNYCYVEKTNTGSQVNGSTPANCASVTAWNSCTPGTCTYKDYYNATDTTCTPTNCTKTPKTVTANANSYVDGASCKTCSSFSGTYTKSDGGSISSNYCYVEKTNTGSQVNGSTPTNCASVTAWNSCTPGTCTYKDYYNATDTTCTPTNCTKTPKTVTASANYYASGTSCSACPSSYPYSGAGATTINSCYKNVTRGCTQNNGSTPSGCSSVTEWNACSCTGGTYQQFYDGTTSGTTTNETCTKTVKKVSASANYYASGTSCPACPSAYPYSGAGSTAITSCYSGTKSRAWSGSQTPCATPTGCSDKTCNSCSIAACDYVAYSNASGNGDGSIKSGCSTNNASCQQTVKSVTAKANYYASGTSCPACPSGYPNSGAGSTAITSCYSNTKSRAWSGSQTPCATPTGCSSATCNSCSGSACDYVAYSNTSGNGDGSIKSGCSTNNASCQQTVKSVTAKANYYTTLLGGGAYTPLEYIESTGTQLIDTGWAETNTTVVDAKFYVVSSSRNYLYGSKQDAGAMMYNGLYNNDSLEYNWLTISFAASNLIEMTQNISGNSITITINGNTYIRNIGTSGGHNMYIHGCNDGGRPYAGTLRTYYFVIKDGNTIVRNFVPAKRNSDGAIGMYDTVTDKFYGNSGSGSFVAGPVSSNYLTCPACPTAYPNSAAGATAITSCYSNTKSRAWSGSQTSCSAPTGCSSATCNSCSGSACDYVAYSNTSGNGDGSIKSGCSTNNASCQQTVKSVTAKANYYASGTSCPACPTNLKSRAGAESVNDCGRFLHIGDETLLLHTSKVTTPSLNVQLGDDVFYGNMAPGDITIRPDSPRKLKTIWNNTVYSIYENR